MPRLTFFARLKFFRGFSLGLSLGFTGSLSWAAIESPFDDLDAAAPESLRSVPADPFVDLDATGPPAASSPQNGISPGVTPRLALGLAVRQKQAGAIASLFGENFSFKKELMFEASRSSAATTTTATTADGWYSRQSLGFEALKKFSSSTATLAAFDLQIRCVRRDNFHEVLNDSEGMDRRGWFLEYHNVYWDFYNIFNPFLNDVARRNSIGRFNLRVGRFYLPFGLNLQTDTHGQVLQLSNERNFGFERDWLTGLWGSLNSHLNYDAYYLLGSGYDVSFKGQSGLIGTRVSLSNKYLNEYGIEGGISFITGERISPSSFGSGRSPVALPSNGAPIVATRRLGSDLRWGRPIPSGSVTLASEISAGRDQKDDVLTQLYQADYLTLNRKLGASIQARRFTQDIQSSPNAAPMGMGAWNGGKTDASILADITWYFRNDLGNTNLHWIKLNIERKTKTMQGREETITTLQYYRYW